MAVNSVFLVLRRIEQCRAAQRESSSASSADRPAKLRKAADTVLPSYPRHGSPGAVWDLDEVITVMVAGQVRALHLVELLEWVGGSHEAQPPGEGIAFSPLTKSRGSGSLRGGPSLSIYNAS